MRHSLVELEDQPWFPATLRNGITAYLRFVVSLTRQMRPVAPAVAELLRRSGESSILDLCSGSGGAARQLARDLAARGASVPVTLSDRYPDSERLDAIAGEMPGVVRVHPAPLDATRVPADMPGVRTMFNAFHHFAPDAAGGILGDAARAGRPIAIIEFIERDPFSLMGVLFSPLLVLLAAPLFRPVRWQTLLFTYVVPAIPLAVFWDGLVSWIRVYSLAELEALAARAAAPGYAWSAGRWRVGPVRVTYLLGYRASS